VSFFFQAEDGIRDFHVTGVQTCALPILARYATGIADDFLNLQLIATQSPVIIAPAMNPVMWEHPSVQDNYRTLRRRGVRFVGPRSEERRVGRECGLRRGRSVVRALDSLS